MTEQNSAIKTLCRSCMQNWLLRDFLLLYYVASLRHHGARRLQLEQVLVIDQDPD
jgi:hypothetical protein